MELSLSHMLHLLNIFRENDGKENCAQVLEEELHRMFGIKYVNDKHDCNVVSMNSLNIHDANDMQSHKLGEAMFDEYDIFSPPSFDENIYYDESMPPIYDDYIDESGFERVSTLGSSDPTILEDVESYCDNYESGFGEVMTLFSDESTISEEVPIDYENKVGTYDDYCDELYAIKNNDNHETCHHDFSFQLDYASHDSYFVEFAPNTIHEKKFAYVESNKNSMLVADENNALCDSYSVEFIHDATENYYEGGIYACRSCNNIKLPLYVLKVLKLCMFSFPMQVDSCYHKLFAHKIPMHRKWVRLKCASHTLHDAPVMFQFLSFM